jgi:diguanylate cyclase (GGDEF)-like protein
MLTHGIASDGSRMRPDEALPRVLLIEDDGAVRALLAAQLAPGYEVHQADTGERGIATALVAPPDVVLLDLSLGGAMQGVDVLDAMNREPALAGVPVIVVTGSSDGETLAGTLTRGAHDFLGKPWNPAELEARVGAAVRMKRLHDGLRAANERLAHEALTDALTGLPNRRQGMAELERLFAHSARHGEPFALIQFDLDGFKRVNDVHGHAAGDALLRLVSDVVRETLRREDTVSRWGGDEFVAVLPGAGPAEAAAVAERLRVAVRERQTSGDPEVRTTLSLGWACVRPGETPEDLLARADEALYEAKRAGRDAVAPRP